MTLNLPRFKWETAQWLLSLPYFQNTDHVARHTPHTYLKKCSQRTLYIFFSHPVSLVRAWYMGIINTFYSVIATEKDKKQQRWVNSMCVWVCVAGEGGSSDLLQIIQKAVLTTRGTAVLYSLLFKDYCPPPTLPCLSKVVPKTLSSLS